MLCATTEIVDKRTHTRTHKMFFFIIVLIINYTYASKKINNRVFPQKYVDITNIRLLTRKQIFTNMIMAGFLTYPLAAFPSQ
jgi:hypothetical protein